MDPFIEYIKDLRANLLGNFKSYSIVLGNESCDLDSTVCSLTLAYFLNKTRNDATKLVLPLLDVLESEFPLRTENIYVLNNIGIKEDYLIYKDTINIGKIKQDKRLELTLVDHHILSKQYEFLKDDVKRIFDHRPLDVNANWKKDVIVDRKIVGSCCTLIAAEILKNNAAILTPTMAKILYDTIIFDTIGLSHAAGKVKEQDIEVCKQLEPCLCNKPKPSELFDELWAAHNDVSKLSPKQLLAKDLKRISNILIPGVPMLVKQFLKYRDISKDIAEFLIEKRCDHMILMGLEAKGTNVKRDLGFISIGTKSKLLQDIIEQLINFKELELQEESSNVEGVRYFTQNPKLSRKQIVPQVQEVLKRNE